jgi:Syntaxin 6, N-terminal
MVVRATFAALSKEMALTTVDARQWTAEACQSIHTMRYKRECLVLTLCCPFRPSSLLIFEPRLSTQREVKTSLQTATALHDSYRRILKTLPSNAHAASEELSWAREELQATLSALEIDVDELDESVKVVESAGNRLFGIEDEEVIERRGFVSRIKDQIRVSNSRLGRPAVPSVRRVGMWILWIDLCVFGQNMRASVESVDSSNKSRVRHGFPLLSIGQTLLLSELFVKSW